MTPIYLESGTKKVFAAALNWPGWSRSGRDEAEALAALLEYGPRYARAVMATGLPFDIPATVADFTIVERLPGSSGTDFGAPLAIPEADSAPFDAAALALSLIHIYQTQRPLYARAAADNAASIRVLEKCGFVLISRERGYANARAAEIDEVLMALS